MLHTNQSSNIAQSDGECFPLWAVLIMYKKEPNLAIEWHRGFLALVEWLGPIEYELAPWIIPDRFLTWPLIEIANAISPNPAPYFELVLNDELRVLASAVYVCFAELEGFSFTKAKEQ